MEMHFDFVDMILEIDSYAQRQGYSFLEGKKRFIKNLEEELEFLKKCWPEKVEEIDFCEEKLKYLYSNYEILVKRS